MEDAHGYLCGSAIKQEIVDFELTISQSPPTSPTTGRFTIQEIRNISEESDCTISNILLSNSGGLVKYEVVEPITNPVISNDDIEKEPQGSGHADQPRCSNVGTGSKSAPNQALICEICSFEAYNKIGFDSHLRAMHDSDRVRCSKCGTMVSKNRLEFHLKKHLRANGWMACSKCDFKGSRRQLWKHRQKLHVLTSFRAHGNRRSYYCKHCQLRFYRRSTLENHTKRHYIKTNYSCKICNSFFANSWYLETHVARRLCMDSGRKVMKSLVCQYCNRKFNTQVYYDVHLRSKHKSSLSYEELAKPILGLTCPVESCRRIFYSPHKLSDHKFRCHKPWRICRYCKLFYPPTQLGSHVKQKHANICAQKNGTVKSNIFGCNKCPSSFSTEIEYDHHLLSHSISKNPSVATNDHTYACSYCHKRFSFKISKDRHEQRMICRKTPVKKEVVLADIVCSYCSKHFSQKSSKERHERKMVCQRVRVKNEIVIKCERVSPENRGGNSFSVINSINTHSEELDSTIQNNTATSMKTSRVKIKMNSPKRVNYLCDSCSVRFPNKSALHLHTKQNTCVKQSSHGPCPGCREEFETAKVLKNHMKYCVHL